MDNIPSEKGFNEIDPRALYFYGLTLAEKSPHRDSSFQDLQTTNYEYDPLTVQQKFYKSKKQLHWSIKKLITNKSLTPEKSQNKWLEDCSLPTNDNINWTGANLLAKKCTKSTKLIELQFKFLHKLIPTNNFLFRTGLQDDEKIAIFVTPPLCH